MTVHVGRHPSWWTDHTRKVLASHGAALCWADRGSRPVTPLWRTADWGYLRLHEGATAEPPRYGRRALAHWVDRLGKAWPDGEAWVYFNNAPHAAAVRDAVEFARAAHRAGLPVGRVPRLGSSAQPCSTAG
jgi:uncharacterized protein YecE (DUF72 family)